MRRAEKDGRHYCPLCAAHAQSKETRAHVVGETELYAVDDGATEPLAVVLCEECAGVADWEDDGGRTTNGGRPRPWNRPRLIKG